MRLALVTPRFCDDPTGIAVLGGLEAAYRELGHRTEVIGRLRPAGRRRRTPFPVIEISVWNALRLMRVVRSCSFVHLHLIGPFDPGACAAWLACRVCAVPFGVTFHDFGNPSAPAQAAWRAGLMGRMLGQARWVSANFRFLKKKIERALPRLAGKVRVVGYGVTGPRKEEPGEAQPAGPGGFVLCVARLMSYKGIDLLLLAWKDVCERFPEANLVICGPDDTGGHYQLLARRLGLSSRVSFVGEQDRARTWGLLASCLFAVVPSRHEAFGLSIIEAMSCGKAVLATRSGGPQEIIEDERTGLLVEAGDVAGLCRGLSRLLEDDGLRARLGRAGRQAAARHCWADAARAYVSLIGGPGQEAAVGRGR